MVVGTGDAQNNKEAMVPAASFHGVYCVSLSCYTILNCAGSTQAGPVVYLDLLTN